MDKCVGHLYVTILSNKLCRGIFFSFFVILMDLSLIQILFPLNVWHTEYTAVFK